jgi:molecular chaperone GrpE
LRFGKRAFHTGKKVRDQPVRHDDLTICEQFGQNSRKKREVVQDIALGQRAARERDETRRAATEAMLGKLLPVLDNFDMALAATNQANVTVETLKVGVSMIHTQLRQVFSDSGVDAVDAVGLPFDPAIHEAVSQQETTDVPEGQVVQQLRKGYRFKDRLLRPATVVVAKKPAA